MHTWSTTSHSSVMAPCIQGNTLNPGHGEKEVSSVLRGAVTMALTFPAPSHPVDRLPAFLHGGRMPQAGSLRAQPLVTEREREAGRRRQQKEAFHLPQPDLVGGALYPLPQELLAPRLRLDPPRSRKEVGRSSCAVARAPGSLLTLPGLEGAPEGSWGLP